MDIETPAEMTEEIQLKVLSLFVCVCGRGGGILIFFVAMLGRAILYNPTAAQSQLLAKYMWMPQQL